MVVNLVILTLFNAEVLIGHNFDVLVVHCVLQTAQLRSWIVICLEHLKQGLSTSRWPWTSLSVSTSAFATHSRHNLINYHTQKKIRC